jgi:hypothetical protein
MVRTDGDGAISAEWSSRDPKGIMRCVRKINGREYEKVGSYEKTVLQAKRMPEKWRYAKKAEGEYAVLTRE